MTPCGRRLGTITARDAEIILDVIPSPGVPLLSFRPINGLKKGLGGPRWRPVRNASSLGNSVVKQLATKMRFLSVVAAASLISACCAAPSAKYSNHVLHEKRDGMPHQWGKRNRAAGYEVMPIRIGLRQRNLEHAERFINEVSDPSSPNFGRPFPNRLRALLTMMSLNRQALDCRAGRQHLRSASGNQGRRDQLADRVRH